MKKLLIIILMSMAFIQSSNATPKELYDLKVKTITGESVPLSKYKGKALLIVNTASRCGYTPQYEGLQGLYKKYQKQGLEVLGFPSNDFGQQEPGNPQEIKKFCESKYHVTFPLFEKNSVAGSHRQELYSWLIENEPGAKVAKKSEVEWNFEKFVISREGKVISRFRSGVTPENKDLVSAIEFVVKK